MLGSSAPAPSVNHGVAPTAPPKALLSATGSRGAARPGARYARPEWRGGTGAGGLRSEGRRARRLPTTAPPSSGLNLAFASPSVTAIWPPTGIALAAVLLWGYRVWPGVALGALLANAGPASPSTRCWESRSGTRSRRSPAPTCCASWRISAPRWSGSGTCSRWRFSAGVVSTTISATIGATSLLVEQRDRLGRLRLRMAHLVARRHGRRPAWSPRRCWSRSPTGPTGGRRDGRSRPSALAVVGARRQRPRLLPEHAAHLRPLSARGLGGAAVLAAGRRRRDPAGGQRRDPVDRERQRPLLRPSSRRQAAARAGVPGHRQRHDAGAGGGDHRAQAGRGGRSSASRGPSRRACSRRTCP